MDSMVSMERPVRELTFAGEKSGRIFSFSSSKPCTEDETKSWSMRPSSRGDASILKQENHHFQANNIGLVHHIGSEGLVGIDQPGRCSILFGFFHAMEKWIFVATALIPQRITRSLSATSSGWGRLFLPSPLPTRFLAGEQMVRSRREALSR